MAKGYFIPCTMARPIGGDVFFRPVRSWHSATYAGEGLEIVGGDRSGCLMKGGVLSKMCSVPLTVTHRQYWHKRDPARAVSAFLSYPNAMGCSDSYFWETYGLGDDVERWFGDNAEAKMERAIAKHFAKVKPKTKAKA